MQRLRLRRSGLGVAFLGLLAPAAVSAQSVVGTASAIDGDSLEVSGRQVRLFGIDAPEFNQTCQKDGTAWACGESAKAQLAALVSGQRVQCRGQGADQHGRILAVCFAGRVEINEVMVEQGWAVAYLEFSDAYLAAELRAKASVLGIWASHFVRPSEFRQAKLPPEPKLFVQPRAERARLPVPQSDGCVIKGNRNRRGEWIYHLPGMPYYEQTRAEEMFCTEGDARAAGYRRAIVRR